MAKQQNPPATTKRTMARYEGRERMAAAPPLAVLLSDVNMSSLPLVGGKNASLGEMIRELAAAGVRVPNGFALTVEAFHLHLREAGLAESIYTDLDGLDVSDTAALARVAQSIRNKIMAAALPEPVVDAALAAYHDLCQQAGEENLDVAVRSSATAEDLPTASFAGQQETFLNVRGKSALLSTVRACMASLFTDRAIVYREHNNIPHRGVGLSVGVQTMVRSDLSCAGVMFTIDTESGYRDAVVINGAWGLGETVVQGRVTPDEYWVHKPTCKKGYASVIRREIGDKAIKLVYAEGVSGGGARTVREVRVNRSERDRPVLTDEEVLQLARWGIAVEEHYSKKAGKWTPMDLEWAKDGRTNELFILQARPETVHSQIQTPRIELFKIRGKGNVLVRGKAVGNKIGAGPARIIHSTKDLPSFKSGEVIVAEMTDPDWEPVLKSAAAVVTDHGGRTCHAAIVSRELGIPCVVGTGNASATLTDAQDITVSCAEGDEGRVYEGRIDFERQEIDPAGLPKPRVPLMLNLANPDRAFHLSHLPAAGVGLLRIEFLITNWIGIHPMALVHPERIDDKHTLAEIRKRTRGFENPAEFFVDRLAHGVGQIAAAFYPRPVIVRFSDFKSNEYAGLLGGRYFEQPEENPMIGFRGASRYYDERYREGFALECRAIKRIRDDMGLTNVKVMIPFCRTITEAKNVLAELQRNGLERRDAGTRPSALGQSDSTQHKVDSELPTARNHLEIYVMCEIPNNVILANEFAAHFDGFSIGSNDLTQLSLGVDRDSELLAHIFDERDPGVKTLISMVVEAAHKCEPPRKVGICGEAPSNYPEFAQWLADIGIDSMSLNPDALPKVAKQLAKK